MPTASLNAESPPSGGLSAIRRSGGLRGKGTSNRGLPLWLPSLSDERQGSAFVGCSSVGDPLLVQHAAARACPGYDRHEAPSMLMEGSSLARETEHGRAVSAQLTRRQDTLEEAIEAGNFALSAAEIPRGIRRQARAACEDYFYGRLNLKPDHPLRRGGNIDSAFELLPDPMYKALENVIELVVDGEWDDLHELSHELLDVEDLRR